MSITIYYGGKIKSTDLIEDLVDEVIEICQVNSWEYQVVDTKTHQNTDPNDVLPHLKGICFGSDESETVWFTFEESGELLSPMVAMFQHQEPKQTKGMHHHAFTKTQQTGFEYHIKLVKLFKYISTKYFDEWYINDESQFYESGDKEHLVESMSLIDKSMAALTDAFDMHGKSMAGKSEAEIKDFIGKVLGSQALDIKVIKLRDEEE